jgi:hypothetical protein
LSENPLLPHRKLRELHALMLRSRDLDRAQLRKRRLPIAAAREAVLAAAAIHLEAGDLLCPEPDDATWTALATAPGSLHLPATGSRLTLATAAACGLKAATTPPKTSLVFASTHAGAAEPGWQAALDWAHTGQLPLLLLCTDSGGRQSSHSITWPAVSRLARRTRLPVLSVDGEDAVALYRVLQESVLRTRTVGGPAIIWAVMSNAKTPLTRSQQPLARLRQYMATRKISLT